MPSQMVAPFSGPGYGAPQQGVLNGAPQFSFGAPGVPLAQQPPQQVPPPLQQRMQMQVPQGIGQVHS